MTVGARDTLETNGEPVKRTRTWFRPILLALMLGGTAIRVTFAISQMSRSLPGDGQFYYETGKLLANGTGFDTLSFTGSGQLLPTAQHPPVLPALLALFDLVGLHSVGTQRIALSLVAGAAILVMGLLGRKVAGPAVGLVAAGIAAVSPLWFQPSGILMSESLYLVAIPVMLLLALLCLEQPTIWRFGLLGLSIAVATLIRSEALDFVMLIGAVVLVLVVAPWRQRLAFGLAFAVGLALALSPWLIRNEIQLGGLALSDNIGGTLSGSYCSSVLNAKQPDYGTWNFACMARAQETILKERPPLASASWTEVALNDRMVSTTLTYVRSHLSEMPGTIVAREKAMAGIGDLGYQLQYAVAEGRSRTLEELGMILDWLLVPFAVVGSAIMARRDWRTFLIVATPFVVVVANVALFYGSTRMRVAAEPSLAVLAATGIVATVTRLRPRSLDADPGSEGARPSPVVDHVPSYP